MSRPKNKSELRAFLGSCQWFRSWIVEMSKICKPFNKLLKDKIIHEGVEIVLQDKRTFKPGMWCDECEQAFIELKKKLISFPVLRSFDPALKTEMVTDASATHVGGALLQRLGDGTAVVIARLSFTRLGHPRLNKDAW